MKLSASRCRTRSFELPAGEVKTAAAHDDLPGAGKLNRDSRDFLIRTLLGTLARVRILK
jgi:hypothetical protein